jgi:hypothetical protein
MLLVVCLRELVGWIVYLYIDARGEAMAGEGRKKGAEGEAGQGNAYIQVYIAAQKSIQ